MAYIAPPADAPRSAWLAAEQGYGANAIAKIERYKLDGTRCGMAQGRHAAWNWAYRIRLENGAVIDMGRALRGARDFAAIYAATIVEVWSGGKTFRRGPRGGVSAVEEAHGPDTVQVTQLVANAERNAGRRTGIKSYGHLGVHKMVKHAPIAALAVKRETRRSEDEAICRVVEILRARGKDELASQLAAVRFEEPKR